MICTTKQKSNREVMNSNSTSLLPDLSNKSAVNYRSGFDQSIGRSSSSSLIESGIINSDNIYCSSDDIQIFDNMELFEDSFQLSDASLQMDLKQNPHINRSNNNVRLIKLVNSYNKNKKDCVSDIPIWEDPLNFTGSITYWGNKIPKPYKNIRCDPIGSERYKVAKDNAKTIMITPVGLKGMTKSFSGFPAASYNPELKSSSYIEPIVTTHWNDMSNNLIGNEVMESHIKHDKYATPNSEGQKNTLSGRKSIMAKPNRQIDSSTRLMSLTGGQNPNEIKLIYVNDIDSGNCSLNNDIKSFDKQNPSKYFDFNQKIKDSNNLVSKSEPCLNGFLQKDRYKRFNYHSFRSNINELYNFESNIGENRINRKANKRKSSYKTKRRKNIFGQINVSNISTDVKFQSVKTLKLDIVKPTRAGVILYTKCSDKYNFCFGTDSHTSEITDFAGHIEYISDKNAVNGGWREFKEETYNIFNKYIQNKTNYMVAYNSDMLVMFINTNIDKTMSHELFARKSFYANKREISKLLWLDMQQFHCLFSCGHTTINSKKYNGYSVLVKFLANLYKTEPNFVNYLI